MATRENYTDSVLITGTAGADEIYNRGQYVTVNAGRGNDTITGLYWYSSISGGAGNDVIDLSIDDVDDATINGGAGNDTIYNDGNDGKNIFQYGSGDGKDVIFGFTENDTLQITSGAITSSVRSGSDFVINVGNGSITLKDVDSVTEFYLIDADGNSSWENVPRVKYGTAKADELVNEEDNYRIEALAGNDTVENFAYNAAIDGGAGNDYLYNSGGNVSIDGGAGNDSIENFGYYAAINGGDGNDYIFSNYANGNYAYNTISGGAGNDTIENLNNDVTINGGTGNDSIFSSGYNTVFQYASGDGKDVIVGFDEADTLQILSGNINSTSVKGADVILNIGSGSITLENYLEGYTSTRSITTVDSSGSVTEITVEASKLIEGTKSADSIDNYAENVTISALDGNDTIENSGDSVKVDAGKGNDLITNFGENVTIDGGDGEDSIRNGVNESENTSLGGYYGAYSSISGGAGNDYILNFAGNVMIDGGKGNDRIENATGGYNTTLNGGDGNDQIYNYTSSVTINGGAGNDYIVNSYTYYTGDGVYGVDSEDVSVSGGDGNDTIANLNANVTIDGGAGNDVIYLVGEYAAGSDYYQSSRNVTVRGGKGNDTIYSNGESNLYQYANGDGKDIIVGFGEADTLQITSGNIKSASTKDMNVVLNIGSGSITLEGAVGKEVNLMDAKGNLSTTVFSGEISLTSKAEHYSNESSNFVIRALAGNDTIYNYASNVTLDGGAGHDYLYNELGNYVSISGGAGNDYIDNSGDGVTIDGGSGHDAISLNSGSAENTITGGKGNDTIYSSGNFNVINYANGDGKDAVYGFSENDTLHITSGKLSDLYAKDADIVAKIGNGTVTLKENIGKNITIMDAAGNVTTTSIVGGYLDGTDSADELYNNSVGYIISGNGGNDTITESGGYSTINGGAGNDTIYTYGYKNTFVYENGDGNDTIFGFYEYDTINVASGAVSKISASGTDVIIKIGSGSMTLKEATGIEINIVDSDGELTSTLLSGTITGTAGADTIENYIPYTVINALGGNDTITNYIYGSSIDGGAGNDYISNFGDNVSIDAGAGNDYITNGNSSMGAYYSSYVSINGGAGNDTIVGRFWDSSVSGGAGSDVIDLSIGDVDYATINGGAGDDTIYNDGYGGYDGNNVFQYGSGDGTDVIFGFTENDTLQITKGSVKSSVVSGGDTVINVGNGSITLKDYTGEVNFGTDGSSSLSAYYSAYFADDNFIGDDTSLDEITDAKYSVAEIEIPSGGVNFVRNASATYVTGSTK